jgi:hypothetical protein
MTGNHDAIGGIGDIPEPEATKLRHLVRKVLDNHVDEFVVQAYRDQDRPLADTAFGPLLPEIREEDHEALLEEGKKAFLGGRDPSEVDPDEAEEYAHEYRFVAYSICFPWLMARRNRRPRR